MLRPIQKWLGRPVPALRQQQASLKPLFQARGKRTQRLAAGASRVINMLSVFSARKKQPRRLKLCREDLVRHEVVQAAWRVFIRNEHTERSNRLSAQYTRISEACEELKKLDPQLFEASKKRDDNKMFTTELRVPTETPPREPWQFKWAPKKQA